nr:hypothetical protein [uncultured Caldimonas sp.]
MTPAQAAEAIIEDLGITQIAELDIEAIAYDAGVEVLYEPMTGCEATLVGVGDHAIATINPSPIAAGNAFQSLMRSVTGNCTGGGRFAAGWTN